MKVFAMARKRATKNIKIAKSPKATLPIAIVFGPERNHCSGVLRGIGRYASECTDWALISIAPLRRFSEALTSIKPAGIIVKADYPGILDVLRKARQPIVNIDTGFTAPNFSNVSLDEISIGAMAANHLVECGLMNFGYFGPPWSGPDSHREGSFRQSLQRLSHTVSVCYVRPPGPDPRGGTFESQKHISRWIHQLPKPAGVFAPNDLWALWLCGLCRREGIKVPEDIAIIGAENDELLCSLAQPPISSIAVPSERVGYEAAAMLDRLINRESVSNRQVLLPATGVVTRQSTNILAYEPDLTTAINYVREHISEPIKIEDILRHTHLPRWLFERKFREALGRSPAQEIRRMRIARAKTLLTSKPDLKSTSIAHQCGFSDLAHFSNAFHQATGMTPTDYRRTMGQESSQGTFSAGPSASKS
jgi:LacI family transcriptional regulator